MRNRKLNLKKETLAELSTLELNSVVGGLSGLSCPIALCVIPQSDFAQCLPTDRCFTGTTGHSAIC